MDAGSVSASALAPDGSLWHILTENPATLRLAPTLLSGMSFRWRKEHASGTFIGVLGTDIYELREDEHGTYFRATHSVAAAAARKTLRKHFRLDDGVITSCYPPWRALDLQLFERAAAAIPGVRVLCILDLLECLVAFVGSANNNIKRCSQMVRALCAAFPSNFIGLDAYGERCYHFPSVSDLAQLDEADLWRLGWGYRAPRVHALTAQLQARGAEAFLQSLVGETELDARAALCELCGVGRKVADCVLLFGYGHDGCVPVDTHCRQLAERVLLPSIKGFSLTPPVYAAIVARFHELFGSHFAGWAFMTM